jgi:hypothetical protein
MTNPTGQGLKSAKKGEHRGGRVAGVPNRFPQELKQAMLDAVSEVGEVNEEPLLDKDGNPTGMTRLTATGKDGLKGYLKWAAVHRANAFLPQLGRIMADKRQDRAEDRHPLCNRRRLVGCSRSRSGMTIGALRLLSGDLCQEVAELQ